MIFSLLVTICTMHIHTTDLISFVTHISFVHSWQTSQIDHFIEQWFKHWLNSMQHHFKHTHNGKKSQKILAFVSSSAIKAQMLTVALEFGLFFLPIIIYASIHFSLVMPFPFHIVRCFAVGLNILEIKQLRLPHMHFSFYFFKMHSTF